MAATGVTGVTCVGSNIIPCNVFRGRETPEQERALIRDAVAVHMNTVRIWGGENPGLCEEPFGDVLADAITSVITCQADTILRMH